MVAEKNNSLEVTVMMINTISLQGDVSTVSDWGLQFLSFFRNFFFKSFTFSPQCPFSLVDFPFPHSFCSIFSFLFYANFSVEVSYHASWRNTGN
jgi:hypothetical protein